MVKKMIEEWFDISVIVAIYNQPEYVASCAESISHQDFRGSVEVLICDDASEDNCATDLAAILSVDSRFSVKIIRSAENEYKKNKGYKDWARYYSMAKGRYVAFLDADDFWVDPRKLSVQYAFLEENPSFSMCFHDFIMASDVAKPEITGRLPDSFKKNYSQSELLNCEYAYILFGTVLCRNCTFEFPGEMRIIENVDLIFPMYMGQFGPCGYCEVILPMIYRQNSKGIWSGATELRKRRQKLRSALLIGAYFLRQDDFNNFNAQIEKRIIPELQRFLQVLKKS